MDYTNYPPGRMRGLAYAQNLMRRYFNQNTRPLFSPIRSSELRQYRHHQTPSRVNIDFYFSLPSENMSYHSLSQLQDVKVGVTLKNLLKHSSVKLNDECGFCVICQDEIKIKEIVRRITNCNHVFHMDCVDQWFSENKKCPVCKFELN